MTLVRQRGGEATVEAMRFLSHFGSLSDVFLGATGRGRWHAALGAWVGQVHSEDVSSSRVRLSAPADLKPALDRWGLSPGEYLLFAGAIEPRKNHVRLLEAISDLRARRRDLPPLILVGPPGWRNQEIHDRLTKSGPWVRYLGFLPREDLAALMAGCAAFVMPSLYEGFGLPVLEAMACSVPVVTSRGGALGEVAGDAAILVDPQNTDEMAAGIEEVLDDTALRTALMRKGLARAAQFSWERTALETLRVYERAIADRHTPLRSRLIRKGKRLFTRISRVGLPEG